MKGKKLVNTESPFRVYPGVGSAVLTGEITFRSSGGGLSPKIIQPRPPRHSMKITASDIVRIPGLIRVLTDELLAFCNRSRKSIWKAFRLENSLHAMAMARYSEPINQ